MNLQHIHTLLVLIIIYLHTNLLYCILLQGMSTTQRSESINAFFDGYVHSKTSLKQFVEQYGRALSSKAEKEFQADSKSFYHMVPWRYGL